MKKISDLLRIPKGQLVDWIDLDNLLEEFRKNNIFPWSFLDSVVTRRTTGQKYIYPKICFNDIFIEPNEYTLGVLRKAIEKSGTQKRLYEMLGIEYNWKQLDNFLKKRNWLTLSVFEKTIQFLGINNDIENILEKCKIRSRGGNEDILKYKFSINPEFARILGFMLTDGSIPISTPVILLTQKDKVLAYEYARELCNFFAYDLSKIRISNGGVKIDSSALRHLLVRFFDIPLGAKITQLRVPSKIMNSTDKEVIKYFIAGIFDGDGCITRYKKKIPEFIITSANDRFLNELRILLKGIKIESKITKRENYSHLRIRNQNDSIKFFVEICPFLKSYRKELADNIFSQSDILDKIRIEKNSGVTELINKSIDTLGSKSKLGKLLLSKGIKLSNHRFVENWNRAKAYQRPTLRGIIEINKLLKNNLTFSLPYPYNQFVRNLNEIQRSNS